MNRYCSLHRFTLIEVVVALAILAGSLAVLLQLMSAGRGRIGRAFDEWERMHMLMQGAEYYLLHSTETASIPERFFPWRDFRIEKTDEEADWSEYPTEFTGISGQPTFYVTRIRLLRADDGQELDSVIVERPDYGGSNALSASEE